MGRHQNGAQGAVEETQLLLHLAQLSQEFLSRTIRMHLNSKKSGGGGGSGFDVALSTLVRCLSPVTGWMMSLPQNITLSCSN